MELNEKTKLADLLKDYPWLLEEAVKIDERFKMLNNPLMKALVQNATVADIAAKGNLNVKDVVDEIQRMIENHTEE
ncbi:MAG: hypothetical protein IKR11_13580 [Solobacterium sp.]|nr:hypothetical protein [Solobacterium sp.]